MDNVLLVLLLLVFLYALGLVSSLGYYLAKERQERVKYLRNEMSRAQSEVDRLRIRSKKFWESVASE
jgi:hypothetical protein